MKKYEEPKIKIIEFESEAVLLVSGGSAPINNYDEALGIWD